MAIGASFLHRVYNISIALPQSTSRLYFTTS
jgi:hypothetical protein